MRRISLFAILLVLLRPASAADAAAAAAARVAEEAVECRVVRPFYWEIGDVDGRRASGSVGHPAPTADSPMAIASASKWIFGAYVVQRRGGAAALGAADLAALTMTSGFHGLRGTCWPPVGPRETVAGCFHADGNDAYDSLSVGRFFYNGSHFQKLAAVDLALGKLDSQGLAAEIARVLGSEFGFTYVVPQLAGGAFTDARHYALFLRAIMAHRLVIGTALGTHRICANASAPDCAQAISSPFPNAEHWSYSLGHWVEDDPVVGDGAFSSAGAFGFYPWIDASQRWYGVLARHAMHATAYYESVLCGREIRAAWLKAQAPAAGPVATSRKSG
jgi:hypothetical protein